MGIRKRWEEKKILKVIGRGFDEEQKEFGENEEDKDKLENSLT